MKKMLSADKNTNTLLLSKLILYTDWFLLEDGCWVCGDPGCIVYTVQDPVKILSLSCYHKTILKTLAHFRL